MLNRSSFEMRSVFLCMLSTRSSIGDGFVQLVNSLDDDIRQNLLVVKTSAYRQDEFNIPSDNVISFDIGKKNLNLSQICRFIVGCVYLTFQRRFAICFVYGVSPLNHLCALFIRSLRYVIWSHDPVLHSRAKFSEKLGLVAAKLFLVLRRKSSAVFVASDTLYQAVLNSFGTLPISVINLPYVESIVNASVEPKRKVIDKESVRILFFGRVEYYKGVDILVNALNLLSRRGFSFDFDIVGPGNDYFPVPECDGYRRLNNYVADQELKEIIMSADICVFPYRDATGTQAVQTALALGTPCLLSSIPLFLEFERDLPDSYITIFDDEKSLIDSLELVIERGPLGKGDREQLSKLACDKYSSTAFAQKISYLLRVG